MQREPSSSIIIDDNHDASSVASNPVRIRSSSSSAIVTALIAQLHCQTENLVAVLSVVVQLSVVISFSAPPCSPSVGPRETLSQLGWDPGDLRISHPAGRILPSVLHCFVLAS
jgi:hypothetical protein